MQESVSILNVPDYPHGLDLHQRSGGVAQVVEHFRQRRGRDAGPGPVSAYGQVATVYACVRAKGDALGRLALMVSDAADTIVETGPLAELTECPNPTMTRRNFWRHTSSHLDLFGRFHWRFITDGLRRPVQVWPLHPLRMEPKVDRGTGELLGWLYRTPGSQTGRREFIPADEVHTVVDPDLDAPGGDDEHAGLSPRRVAMRAISQIWKADLANEASLDNGVEPGGALETNNNLSDDQRRDLIEQVNERHAGVKNRRRLLLLEGGLNYKPFTVSFADAEFTELKKMSREDVAAAFNVPPAVIGYYADSNYAHADAAQQMFWINTIIPRGEWLAEEWTLGVLSRFTDDRSARMLDAVRRAVPGKLKRLKAYTSARATAAGRRQRFFAWFDASGVPAVQKAQLALAAQVKEWTALGVPLNQSIDAFDLPYERVPWGDTWYKPFGLMDVKEDTMPGANDPDFTTPPESPGEGNSGEATRDDAKARRRAAASPAASTAVRDGEAQKVSLWRRWRASWAALERAMHGKTKRHVNELRAETLKRLKERVPPGKAFTGAFTGGHRRNLIGAILFDLIEANDRLMVKVGPLVRDSFRLGGEQTMQEAAAATGLKPEEATPFRLDDPLTAAKLRQRNLKVTGMNRTLQKQLAKQLAEGVEAGEGVEELGERVKHTFNVAGNRARVIARQEVSAAVEEARHEARRQAGVPLKSWLWSRKHEGRAMHAATEEETARQPIPADQDFTIAGTSITCPHPRAANLPADQSINCACTSLSRYPDDSLKSMLARYAGHGFLSYEGLQRLDALRARTPSGKDADSCPGTN